MPEPFAKSADLVKRWRPLSSAETVRADELLASASRKVRRRWRDVDARILAETLDADDVADVVLEMVQAAMVVPELGVTQAAETTGPFSASRTYDNPAGRLYFTKDQVSVFEDARRHRAFSVDLTPRY